MSKIKLICSPKDEWERNLETKIKDSITDGYNPILMGGDSNKLCVLLEKER